MQEGRGEIWGEILGEFSRSTGNSTGMGWMFPTITVHEDERKIKEKKKRKK